MTDELTADDITAGTEIIYQAPDKRFQTEKDYYESVRGTVVDVEDRTIHSGPDSSWEKTVVILEDTDGETVETNIKNLVDETDYRVNIVPDVDEGDDEDESETGIVADGGEDVTDHVDNETIEDAIDRHDDPEDAGALTIEDTRDLLEALQHSFEEHWDEHLDLIEDGHLEVIAETSDVLVLADHTGHGWSEELNDLSIGQIDGRVLKSVHHNTAARYSDYTWAAADPFVLRKPTGSEIGQRLTESIINSLLQRGLSPGQAWAYYGVEIRGHSRNSWATRCGYSDHSAVSEPLRKAHEKLP